MTKQEALKKIEELKEFIEQEESGQWKPGFGETYYILTSYGSSDNFTWADDEVDNRMLQLGNVFLNREEVDKHALRLESMAVKWLPKMGDWYYTPESEPEGKELFAERSPFLNDAEDYSNYFLGRIFKTEADCEAWISKYSSAWSL